jgi:neutral trehalase
MMNDIQAEITAIQTQIEALCQERTSLTTDPIDLESASPEEIANAYRRRAKQDLQLFAEVKGIDDAIAALEAQLAQKIELASQPQNNSLEQRVVAGKRQALAQAERINQLAAELAAELRSLKATADELSPSYWQVYYKPLITGFRSISVPYVRTDSDVLTIVNRIV